MSSWKHLSARTRINNYIVSNAKLEATGYRTSVTLEAGIAELIKGFTMLKNSKYGNV